VKIEHVEDTEAGEAVVRLSGAEPNVRYDVAVTYEGHSEDAAAEYAKLQADYEAVPNGARLRHPILTQGKALLGQIKQQHFQVGTDQHGDAKFSYPILHDGDVTYKFAPPPPAQEGPVSARFPRQHPHAHKLEP
jgi:hypothetical protein